MKGNIVKKSKPAELELIASGETTEEVNSVLITTDNDGNPFELCDMITIYTICPAGKNASSLSVNVNTTLIQQLVGAVKTDVATVSKLDCVHNGKRFEGTSYVSAGTGGNANLSTRARNLTDSQRNLAYQIKLYLYDSSLVLPVGFKYEIYGRRVKNANT